MNKAILTIAAILIALVCQTHYASALQNCPVIDPEPTLNVRATANGRIVSALQRGDQVNIVTQAGNGWVLIASHAASLGWIYARYLDCSMQARSSNRGAPDAQSTRIGVICGKEGTGHIHLVTHDSDQTLFGINVPIVNPEDSIADRTAEQHAPVRISSNGLSYTCMGILITDRNVQLVGVLNLTATVTSKQFSAASNSVGVEITGRCLEKAHIQFFGIVANAADGKPTIAIPDLRGRIRINDGQVVNVVFPTQSYWIQLVPAQMWSTDAKLPVSACGDGSRNSRLITVKSVFGILYSIRPFNNSLELVLGGDQCAAIIHTLFTTSMACRPDLGPNEGLWIQVTTEFILGTQLRSVA